MTQCGSYSVRLVCFLKRRLNLNLLFAYNLLSSNISYKKEIRNIGIIDHVIIICDKVYCIFLYLHVNVNNIISNSPYF